MENTIIQLAKLVGELSSDNLELRESLNNRIDDCVLLKSKYNKLLKAATAFVDNKDVNQSLTLLHNLETAVNTLR